MPLADEISRNQQRHLESPVLTRLLLSQISSSTKQGGQTALHENAIKWFSDSMDRDEGGKHRAGIEPLSRAMLSSPSPKTASAEHTKRTETGDKDVGGGGREQRTDREGSGIPLLVHAQDLPGTCLCDLFSLF
jgi:hypothetical protein